MADAEQNNSLYDSLALSRSKCMFLQVFVKSILPFFFFFFHLTILSLISCPQSCFCIDFFLFCSIPIFVTYIYFSIALIFSFAFIMLFSVGFLSISFSSILISTFSFLLFLLFSVAFLLFSIALFFLFSCYSAFTTSNVFSLTLSSLTQPFSFLYK